MSLIDPIRLAQDGPTVVDGVADGYEAFALAAIAAGLGEQPLGFVVPRRATAASHCRNASLSSRRPAGSRTACVGLPCHMTAFRRVQTPRRGGSTPWPRWRHWPRSSSCGDSVSANALLQRMPPADAIAAQSFVAKRGQQVGMNELAARLETSGFERVPTVRDVGEFAVRGGILDLYAPGRRSAAAGFLRRHAESIRAFDVASQPHDRPAPVADAQAMSEGR